MSLLAALKKLFGFSSGPGTLQPGDKMLVCEDCKSQFIFDAGEQRFFKEKGFSEPKRCPRCRKKVRFRMRRRGGRGRGERGERGGQGQNNNQNQNRNNNQHNQHQGNRHGNRHRHHSVIDGDSPYADER